MAIYTARVTNDENGIVAWVDLNGERCIMQPHSPSNTENWATEADAQAWADKHALDLEQMYQESVAAEKRKKDLEESQHAANLAMVEQSKALAAILEKLTNPTA